MINCNFCTTSLRLRVRRRPHHSYHRRRRRDGERRRHRTCDIDARVRRLFVRSFVRPGVTRAVSVNKLILHFFVEWHLCLFLYGYLV